MGKKENLVISVEQITDFSGADLIDLCNATELTASDDRAFSIGFSRTGSQSKEPLEKYWKGVLIVPERMLFVGRVDHVVAGAIQLVMPSPSNETRRFAAVVESHFVAPWARGEGLAHALLKEVERVARERHITLLKLSVRADQESAIALYESEGYKRWGELEHYEQVVDQMIAGYYYCKHL